jgi:HK97 family phage major capsid protein
MNAKRIIEAKQERANIYENIKSICNEFEGVEMDAIKKEELTKLEARFDALNDDIVRAERNLERERIVSRKDPDPELPEEPKEEKIINAFKDYLRNYDNHAYSVYNALQQDNATQAGYLVAPQKFVMELIADLDNILFFRNIAKVLPTLTGAQSLGYPKRKTRMSSAAWGTEIQAPTADTALDFGKKEFKPNPATAEILVSKTLLKNAPNVDAIVRNEMAYNFGTLLETAYMTGNGVNKPLGVFTASSDGISTSRDVSTGNTTTEMKFDGLKEAKYKIASQYQKNLSWIFHRDGVKQIAKLKDADGQYIWQQSVSASEPDRLLGVPVMMSEYAPNTFTTGLYVGLIGDFSNYWICDSMNMEIVALNELYARTNQVDFIGRIETDGMPVVEEAFSRVKLA